MSAHRGRRFDALPLEVVARCAALADVGAATARLCRGALRDAVRVQRTVLVDAGEPDDPDAVALRWSARWARDVTVVVPQYCSVELAVAAVRAMPPGGTVEVGAGSWDPPEPPGEIRARSAAIAAALPHGVTVRITARPDAPPIPPHLVALCAPFYKAGRGVAFVVHHVTASQPMPAVSARSLRAAVGTALVRLCVPEAPFTKDVVELLGDTGAVPRLRDLDIGIGSGGPGHDTGTGFLATLVPVVRQLDRFAVRMDALPAALPTELVASFARLTELEVTVSTSGDGAVACPGALLGHVDRARLRQFAFSATITRDDDEVRLFAAVGQAARGLRGCSVLVQSGYQREVRGTVRGDEVDLEWNGLVYNEYTAQNHAAFASAFPSVRAWFTRQLSTQLVGAAGAGTLLRRVELRRVELRRPPVAQRLDACSVVRLAALIGESDRAAATVPGRPRVVFTATTVATAADGWPAVQALEALLAARRCGDAVRVWLEPAHVPPGRAFRDLPGGIVEVVLAQSPSPSHSSSCLRE